MKERIITGNVVSKETLRKWLYIDNDCLDEKLEICLSAAVAAAETHTQLVLAPSLFKVLRDFPLFSNKITLDIHPAREIISVLVDGIEVPSAHYKLTDDTLIFDDSVHGEKLEIKLAAGGQPVADDVKLAILLIASDFFQHPVDTVRQLTSVSEQLLNPYRYHNI